MPQERSCAQAQDADHLGGREQRLGSRALARAQHVDPGEEQDGEGARAELRALRQVQRLAEVEREHARDRSNHGRLDHPQVGPAEDEAGRVAERLADVDVEAAGLGVRHRQLGERERAADREDAAQDPGGEHDREAREVLRHAVRRAEDPGADDVAHRDRGRGVEADLALELDLGAGRGVGGRGHAILR